MQNVNEALAALPSLPPGSISVQRLPNVQNQGPSLDAQPGKARGRPRRSPQRLRRPTDAHGNSQDYAGGRFARGGGRAPEPDSAALEHRRMLCRSLPTTQHLLEAPQPREDCRFVQLQLTVLLQGCASVEGGGDAYRTLIVSGNATLYETAQAISAAFGLIDARDMSKPLPPQLECIFEDVLVGEDGLTIENREIAGLEWRDHATRVFHPNVYNDGQICLDILQNQWSPIYDISAILTSIQSLLSDPNPASPANSEASRLYSEHRREYDRRVREVVEQSWSDEPGEGPPDEDDEDDSDAMNDDD